jgi:hypothetical protein
MIEWLTGAELDARLATYPPIGLQLRAVFHARTSIVPEAWFSRSAEQVEEAGLGTTYTWSGLVDSIPFSIAAAPRRTGWGFEVRLPQRSDGDRAWVTAIRALGLPAWTQPYFESLPIERGFGVAAIADPSTPIYQSENRDDATAIAAMLNYVEPATYATVPVSGDELRWLVVGPDAGPYISRIAFAADEPSARALAARWTTQTGADFRVAPRLHG